MKFRKISMFLPALVLCCCAFFLSACGDNRLEREAPSISTANIIVVDRTVTIDGFSNALYSKDKGVNWQETNIFADLVYDKTYSFCVKIKADENYKESPVSNIVEKKISKAHTSKPVLNSGNFVVEGNKLVVNGFNNAMYSIDNGATWQESNIFVNLTNAQTYAIRVKYKETDSKAQSEPSDAYMYSMPKNEQDAPLLEENKISYSQDNKLIHITGFSNVVEFSIDGGKTAQNSNIFSNLIAGSTYNVCVRYKETATSYESEWSNIVTVTFDKDSQFKPYLSSLNIVQNEFDLQVTGFEDRVAQFSIDGGTTWQESNIFSNLTIGNEYFVSVQLLETASLYGTEKSDNFAYTMQKIARQTPILTQANVTQNEYSLSISGFENEDAMYSIDNGENWQASNTFNELSLTGTYIIRVKLNETATHLASEISNQLAFAMQKLTNTNVPIITANDISQNEFKLTITKNDDYEYSINGGESWQKNNVFTIEIGKTYNVTVRYAETATHKPSAGAELIAFTTQKLTQTAPTISSDDITQNDFNLIINKYSNAMYSIDNGATWQESNIFENLTIGTTYQITVKYTANADYNESEPATAIEFTMQKLTQTAPSLTTTIETENNIQYIVITPIEGALYKFNDGAWSTENRLQATCEDEEIAVSIKMQENENYNESPSTDGTTYIPHTTGDKEFATKYLTVNTDYVINTKCEKCGKVMGNTTGEVTGTGIYMFTNYSDPQLLTNDISLTNNGSGLLTFILAVSQEDADKLANDTLSQKMDISYVCNIGVVIIDTITNGGAYDIDLRIIGLKEINVSYQLGDGEVLTKKITFPGVSENKDCLETFVGEYTSENAGTMIIKKDNDTYKVLLPNAVVSAEDLTPNWQELTIYDIRRIFSGTNINRSVLMINGVEFGFNIENGTLTPQTEVTYTTSDGSATIASGTVFTKTTTPAGE